MFDLPSTLFPEVQRVSYTDIVGEPEYDRRTYEVLLGDDGARPLPRPPHPPRTGRLARTAMLPVLIALAVLAIVLA